MQENKLVGLPTVPVTAKNTTAGGATCYGSEGEEPLIGHETISEVPGTYVKGKSIRKFFGVPEKANLVTFQNDAVSQELATNLDFDQDFQDDDQSSAQNTTAVTGYIYIDTETVEYIDDQEQELVFAPASPLTGIPVYQIDREMSPMFTGDSDWEERSPMFGIGRSRTPIFPQTSIFACKDETLQTEYVSEYSADHIRQMWSSQVPANTTLVPAELDEGDLSELSDQFSFYMDFGVPHYVATSFSEYPEDPAEAEDNDDWSFHELQQKD